MANHFMVERWTDGIKIVTTSTIPLVSCFIYTDNRLAAVFYEGDNFYLKTNDLPRNISVVAHYLDRGIPMSLTEQFHYKSLSTRPESERTFNPGDILVASDNVKGAYTGYMGHSAIVVDDNHVIESPGGYPALRKDSIQQFLDKHPEHAQFSPKSDELGKKAASYAEEYLEKYKKNLQEGKNKPVFSFNLSQSLNDPWEYIYCSKLIYLCYVKGANYQLENDFLWYSPEDLYTNLKENKDFDLVYEHKDVGFDLDT